VILGVRLVDNHIPEKFDTSTDANARKYSGITIIPSAIEIDIDKEFGEMDS
jgi:hypothetical protein